MKLSERMEQALNAQINEELASAYIYLAMAAYCESINLKGFAHWMQAQVQEELIHAAKLYDYVNDRGGRVVLQAIARPPAEFNGPVDVFEKTLAHEQHITGCIHDLFALAMEEKDFASYSILQWFVDEQVEEESTAGEILERLKMIGDNKQGLVMLDQQLGARPMPVSLPAAEAD